MNSLPQLKQQLAQYGYAPDIVLLKQQTSSTNDDMLSLWQQSPDLTSILICSEQQTQGRGQYQRIWHSPQGNIYFSCLAQTQSAINGRFALEVALNILNSQTFSPYPLKIKWANDLFSPQGKWGGILIEPISPHQAIVGIGINLSPVIADTTAQYPITSLQELNIQYERIQLIAELYHAVQQAIQWFDCGSVNLISRFQHHGYLIGQDIMFETTQQTFQGQYLGVDADGALQLKTVNGIQNFYQGRIHPSSII